MLAEQDKYICLNQDKTLGNLQQRIAFVYGPLTKIWTAMEAEKESYLAEEGEANPLFEMSKLFDQVVLLLGQAMNSCSYIRRFNVLMSFVGDKKRVESMLKDNATAFSDACNMLFGSKYEELVAKSLSSKNKSKELFGSIKNQGSSKEGSRRQPFRKGPLFRSRGNRGRGIFTAAGQTLQQQYPTGGQGRGKNEFINSTLHQLDGPSACISILQNTSTSSEFISSKNQATAQSRQSKTFCKELAKTDKRFYDTGYSKRLRNPFYFAAKAIKATKFVPINQRSVRPSRSGGPGHVEERCYSSFGSQRGPISQFFVSCEKEGGGNRPVVNLKDLNRNIPYRHFKMEGLFLLKEMLLPGDKMCKIDLKDAYFAIPLSVKSRKYVRFQWKGLLYEFCCLCFGLSPAPLVFTKLLKVPISLLRKLNVRIIIYLDDMLLMASSLEDLLMARDTLIFILQHLGFLINIKKSYLEPTSTLEFLGVIVDSGEMTLSLPKEKLLKVQNHCQEILENGKVTVRELSKLIGRLSSTAIAVLPAPLHYRHLQHQQIQKLISHNSFEEKVELSVEARKELLWWKENLILCNGRSLISSPPQIIISSDASLQGWGASCHGLTTGGPWSMEERKFHINVLELKAAKLAIMSLTLKERDAISVHIRMNNMAALSYLMKMGGTKNQELTAISKEIWQYLLKRKITITAEYLPGSMNVEADRESRQTRDSSEWKLNPTIFMKLCQIRGTPEVDLFASRVSHQLPHYISWKIDPFSQGRDAFQISWAHKFVYAFPPFALIGRILQKVNQDQCLMLIITPAWPGQPWFPGLLKMYVKNPLLLPALKDLLKDPAGKLNPLVIQNSLRLVAWTISGRTYLQKEYQKGLPILSQTIGEHLQLSITSQLGRSGVAGVLNGRYLPLDRI